jgi:hypothetical protein
MFGGLGAQGLVKRKPTRRCGRCGLRYPKDKRNCTHCTHLKTDQELSDFKSYIVARRKNTAKLGRQFLLVAVLLSLIMLVIF